MTNDAAGRPAAVRQDRLCSLGEKVSALQWVALKGLRRSAPRNRTAPALAGVTVAGVALATALATLGLRSGPTVAAQPGAPRPTVEVEVDLPSVSTGTPSGTLAVVVAAPASPAEGRYPDGAPVVIVVPGGTGAGSLQLAPLRADDIIRIAFLLPGGRDVESGRRSDGQYDYRGRASIAALRDVVLYAGGSLPDAQGRTIDAVLPVGVRTQNIGLLGLSNGGNLATALAATAGAAVAGHLRYIVQWETPVSSQIATVDIGGLSLVCPGNPQSPRRRLAAANPRYVGYGAFELAVRFTDLAYDSEAAKGRVFHDGTGDGAYTAVRDPTSGCLTPDLDLDGVLTDEEDWPLESFTDGQVRYYSRAVTRALDEADVFGRGWPRGIATTTAADDFWLLRESVRHYDAAVAAVPGLEGMVLASVVDHVQAAPDHPHIRQAFEGWDRAGAWVRINPVATFVSRADPGLGYRPDLPHNSPNTPPEDWREAATYAMPEDIPDDVTQTAAVWQMADRAEARTPAVTPTDTPTPAPTVGAQRQVFLPVVETP